MRISRGVFAPVTGVVWLLSVLVTAGCLSPQADSPTENVDKNLGRQVLQDLTPLERTILADKSVTRGEYELAVQDTVSCLRTAGFTVSNPVNAADGSLQYMASYSPPEMATAAPDAPPPDSRKMDADNAACERRSAAAGAVFMLQHVSSEEEAKQAFGVLITCAKTHGIKISVSEDSRDIGKVFDEIAAAKRQGLITGDQENRCENSFRASTFTALPGLSEALADYKG